MLSPYSTFLFHSSNVAQTSPETALNSSNLSVLESVKDMLWALNNVARNHVVHGLSLPLAVTSVIVDALSFLRCDSDIAVVRLFELCPIIATSAIIQYESLSFSRSCARSGSLAWWFWRIIDAVYHRQSVVDDSKDSTTGGTNDRDSLAVEGNQWLYGVTKLVQVQ